MRVRVNGSLSHSTAITMANSALVSRRAAAVLRARRPAVWNG